MEFIRGSHAISAQFSSEFSLASQVEVLFNGFTGFMVQRLV